MKWELFSEKKKKHKTIYNKNCYRKKEKKSNLEVSNKGKNSTQNVLGDITNWPA